ncbi:MAG: I78 family peptidase inhibitor [Alphaproteobacteria bacterium]
MARASIFTLCAAFLVVGCAPEPGTRVPGPPPSPPQAGLCVAERASDAIGRRATPDLAEQVRAVSGARAVRIMEPGRAYTMEFDPERVSLVVDRRNVVTDVRCG